MRIATQAFKAVYHWVWLWILSTGTFATRVFQTFFTPFHGRNFTNIKHFSCSFPHKFWKSNSNVTLNSVIFTLHSFNSRNLYLLKCENINFLSAVRGGRWWPDGPLQKQESLPICTWIISRWFIWSLMKSIWCGGGSESDPLTVLNMVMVTAANKFRNSPYFVRLSKTLSEGWRKIFRWRVALLWLPNLLDEVQSQCYLLLLEVNNW